MEERPSELAQEKRRHHEEERNPSPPKKSLKNDQSHCQQQETPTKKTGNGKVNGNVTERKKILSALESVSIVYPANGHVCADLDTNLQLKHAGKVPSAEEVKCSCVNNNSMDSKNDVPLDFNSHQCKEFVTVLNGVVGLSSLLTNGYPGKPSADTDGSGSESSSGTPKKRRSQRGGLGCVEDVTELHTMHLEQAERRVGSQGDSIRTAPKVKAPALTRARPPSGLATGNSPAGELQRKNLDVKAISASGKRYEERPNRAKHVSSLSAKEDSWTLFKPPPVFPVDNSSAKIVPKISYASKVKENLNKTVQIGTEPSLPAVPGRPRQVPMSAMKTITSASFTNGPVSGEGSTCPPSVPVFSTTAGSVPLSSSLPAGENVAAVPENGGSALTAPSTTAGEHRKPSLFVCSVGPQNMQPSLPSGRQVEPPSTASNQKALGDIFQNQWGLSFINEPSAGPEGTAGRQAGKGQAMDATYERDYIAASDTRVSPVSALGQEHQSLPKAYDPEMRTSSQTLSVIKACPLVALAHKGWTQTQPLELDAQEGEAAHTGAIVFASLKDPDHEAPQAHPVSPPVVPAKQPGHAKGFERRCSWGSFDLRAAVTYHTKEMEYILNLQKQDPKRVLLYDKSQDGPNQ